MIIQLQLINYALAYSCHQHISMVDLIKHNYTLSLKGNADITAVKNESILNFIIDTEMTHMSGINSLQY